LLGVPEEDHVQFRTVLGAPRAGANVGSLDHDDLVGANPLEWLDEKFIAYLEDRRREPRDDVLTALATAKYPDSSTPPLIQPAPPDMAVVRSTPLLFAAGQESMTKLLSGSMKVLGERPDIQEALRKDRSRIPIFVEEALRMEAPVKSQHRLATKNTRVGDVDVP